MLSFKEFRNMISSVKELFITCYALGAAGELATADSDYTSRPNDDNSRVTFAHGSDTAICTVAITDDTLRENDEDFHALVAIHDRGELGTQLLTVVTIGDNESER